MSRRQSLSAINPSSLNIRANSNPRQSLGPSRMSDAGAPPLPNSRMAVGATTCVNVGRRPSNPRGSTAGAPRMSMSQPPQARSSAAGRADPRNVSDRRFMNASIRSLLDYLSLHNYDHSISPKILSSPSGKDFNNIVQFLFRQIDPNLILCGKFEDEIISIFKFLRYPFSISKNGLAAVGSPHSWPQLLASLMWILELLEYDEEVLNQENQLSIKDRNELSSTQSPLNDEEMNKSFYTYLSKAYTSFLSGDDETYSHLEQDFVQSFSMSQHSILQSTQQLESQNEELLQSIKEIEVRSMKLPQLKEKRNDYRNDQLKFEQLIDQLTQHLQHTQTKSSAHQHELERVNETISSVENDITALKQAISVQEISAEDVRKMSEEKEHLTLSIQHTASLLSTLQKKVWDSEVLLRDKVNNLEESVRLFNSMSEELDYAVTTAGTTPEKANIKKKIRIEIDTRAKKRNDFLLTDIRRDIIPRLSRMKSVLSDAALSLRGDVVLAQDSLEELDLQQNKIAENKNILEVKVKRLDDIYKKERANLENFSNESEREIDELERALTDMRSSEREKAKLNELTQEMIELKNEILRAREKHEKRKREMNDEIVRSVSILAEYKEIMKERLGQQRELLNQKLESTLQSQKPLSGHGKEKQTFQIQNGQDNDEIQSQGLDDSFPDYSLNDIILEGGQILPPPPPIARKLSFMK